MRPRRLHVLIPGSPTTLIGPEGDRRILLEDGDDSRLGAARLDDLISRAGARRLSAVIIVSSSPDDAARWCAVIAALSFPTVVVSRPVAAVSGLGLLPGSGRMVLDRREDGLEVSVVTEDGVIATAHEDRQTVTDVACVARSVFARIDPDLEWAIRTEGVDLLSHGFNRGWTEHLAQRLGIAVHVTADPVALLHAGVKADRAVIERCLEMTPAPSRRRPAPARAAHGRRSAAY